MEIFKTFLWKCISFALKFWIVYYVIGTAALTIIGFCYFIILAMTGDTGALFGLIESNDPVVVNNLILEIKSTFSTRLPFSEILDKAVDGSGGILEILNRLRGQAEDWESFSRTLFPSLVISSLANFIIYCLNRVNAIFSYFFQGFAYKLALFLSLAILSISGYAVTITIMVAVEHYTPTTYFTAICVLIFLFSSILHALFLSEFWRLDRKISLLKTLKYVFKNLLKGAFFSILLWFVCETWRGLFVFSEYDSFILAFLIWAVALAIDRNGLPDCFSKRTV